MQVQVEDHNLNQAKVVNGKDTKNGLHIVVRVKDRKVSFYRSKQGNMKSKTKEKKIRADEFVVPDNLLKIPQH